MEKEPITVSGLKKLQEELEEIKKIKDQKLLRPLLKLEVMVI